MKLFVYLLCFFIACILLLNKQSPVKWSIMCLEVPRAALRVQGSCRRARAGSSYLVAAFSRAFLTFMRRSVAKQDTACVFFCSTTRVPGVPSGFVWKLLRQYITS